MLRHRAASHVLRRLQTARGLCESSIAPASRDQHTAAAAVAAAWQNAGPAQQQLPRRSGWQLAFAALLGLGGAATCSRAEADNGPSPAEDQGFSLLSLQQRRRTFFKYEKRIREMSPPEKVFEYFASQRDGKSFNMTAGDMMRSVVPVFPPEGSDVIRAGSLPGEPSPHVHENEPSKFIAKFDINGDNAVSFDEYLLFRTLLSIPLDDLEVAFRLMDKDGSGKVDRGEFCQLLDAIEMRAGKPSVTMRKSVHDSNQDLFGLMSTFFGANGRGQLSLEAFRCFVVDLRDELLRLEFQYYDWQDKGHITGLDFAHSIIGCARLKHIDQYLDKCQAMPPQLAGAQLTFQDFKHFREVWRQLRLLAVALEFLHNTSGRVGRDEFRNMVQHVMGVELRPQLVDILFALFGDQNEHLNVNFMYQVLSRHYATGLHMSYNFDKPSTGKSYLDCVRECMSK